MKEQFKNLTYVCHSLFAAIVSTFWEIAAIVSTAIASSAIASTAIASTAIVSYTLFGLRLFFGSKDLRQAPKKFYTMKKSRCRSQKINLFYNYYVPDIVIIRLQNYYLVFYF